MKPCLNIKQDNNVFKTKINIVISLKKHTHHLLATDYWKIITCRTNYRNMKRHSLHTINLLSGYMICKYRVSLGISQQIIPTYF